MSSPRYLLHHCDSVCVPSLPYNHITRLGSVCIKRRPDADRDTDCPSTAVDRTTSNAPSAFPRAFQSSGSGVTDAASPGAHFSVQGPLTTRHLHSFSPHLCTQHTSDASGKHLHQPAAGAAHGVDTLCTVQLKTYSSAQGGATRAGSTVQLQHPPHAKQAATVRQSRRWQTGSEGPWPTQSACSLGDVRAARGSLAACISEYSKRLLKLDDGDAKRADRRGEHSLRSQRKSYCAHHP